jgi:hypothetical protein
MITRLAWLERGLAVDKHPSDGELHVLTKMPLLHVFYGELHVLNISWLVGWSSLSFWVLFFREEERREWLFVLSLLPSKICASCEWLVTGCGNTIHSEFLISILCQILYSHAFFFLRIFRGIFVWRI